MRDRIWPFSVFILSLGLMVMGFKEQDCRRAMLATRNSALELAADYLNALGPDRTLSAFEAARAVRALVQERPPGCVDAACETTPKEEK